MKSFLEGRPIVSRTGLPEGRPSSQLPNLDSRTSTDSTAAAATADGQVAKREHREKKIETVTLDGVIQKIIVTCGCGERIEVHCGY